MGFTRIHVEIGKVFQGNGKEEFTPVSGQELLVDTKATYSTLPTSLLQKCGVTEGRKVALKLADGRVIERSLGYVWMIIEGIRIQTPVLFGEEEDPVLLGVIALEDANLMVDPVTRQLLKGNAYIQY